jgi:hypothetical protein
MARGVTGEVLREEAAGGGGGEVTKGVSAPAARDAAATGVRLLAASRWGGRSGVARGGPPPPLRRAVRMGEAAVPAAVAAALGVVAGDAPALGLGSIGDKGAAERRAVHPAALSPAVNTLIRSSNSVSSPPTRPGLASRGDFGVANSEGLLSRQPGCLSAPGAAGKSVAAAGCAPLAAPLRVPGGASGGRGWCRDSRRDVSTAPLALLAVNLQRGVLAREPAAAPLGWERGPEPRLRRGEPTAAGQPSVTSACAGHH